MYRTEALLPFPYEPLAQMLRAQIKAHELEPEETKNQIVSDAQYGRLGARRTGAQVTIFVESEDEALLYLLQADITEHILELIPDLAIDWSKKLDEGARPPNFHRCRVAGVAPIGAEFLRVRLQGATLSALSGDHLHFRLLLPPRADAPVWPHIGDRGQTVWPKGDDALHRAVYTTRAIGDDWVELDVFRHAGGRTSDWAATQPLGQEVAVIGPGGGGLPDGAERLLLVGDETALPAIARMLEDPRCPADTKVVLSGGALDYPLPQEVARVPDLVAAAQEAAAGRFVWMGAGRDQVQAVRETLNAAGHPKREMALANYWS